MTELNFRCSRCKSTVHGQDWPNLLREVESHARLCSRREAQIEIERLNGELLYLRERVHELSLVSGSLKKGSKS